MSVVEHLDPAWSRAFLRRTRLLDADFQGDVLAVISAFPMPRIGSSTDSLLAAQA